MDGGAGCGPGRRRTLVAALVAVLLVGACSTGSSGAPSGEAPSSTTAPGRSARDDAPGGDGDRGSTRAGEDEAAEWAAACPTLGADLDRLVRRFRGADGACLPAGAASTYRCSPTATVPVAVVGGRRFLGGAHATEVAALPATAVVTATAEDGVALVSDPADPGGLLVAAPSGVERWPAVPQHLDATGAPVEGTYRPAVFLVGDSVVLGAEPQLRAGFGGWSLTVDAAVSRFTREGIDVLRARRAEVADIVVVALGYNDGIDVEPFRATAGALLDELAAVPLVVWVNLRVTEAYDAADDVVLAELAAVRPNLVVADWAAASAGIPPEHFAADGLHLRPVAAQAMADLVISTVLGWHRRHPDQGDQSCRPALDAALGAGA